MSASSPLARRAEKLFSEHQTRLFCQVDRLFAGLMLAQWVLGIVVALTVSPYGWAGKVKQVHVHVWVAVGLGGALSSLPIALALLRSGRPSTRHAIAIAQMLWSALLIHLTGGRIETHFHVFGSLAFLAFYRDWRVLPTAVLVVAGDHLLRGILWSESVYGVMNPEWWRFLEHAFWVVFEGVGLAIACLRGVAEMRDIALARATSEELSHALAVRVSELNQAQAVAHMGSWSHDIATGELAWSDELYRIFGLDPQTFRPTVEGLLAAVHPHDLAIAESTIGTTPGGPFSREYRVVRPDGEVRQLLVRGSVMSDGAGNPIRAFGTTEDTTERKGMEERLRLADRMTTVGTLAAGIAHEINNPLAFVLSNLELVGHNLPGLEAGNGSPAEPGREAQELTVAVAEARQGAQRIRTIVRELKAFSRGDEEQRGPLHLAPVLDAAAKMACNEIRHRARLVKEYATVPLVDGNEGRLTQVFLNLLINAAQAIPEGDADRNEIRITTRLASDGKVEVDIRDTGCGIAPPILRRIFDPFFTTKPIGVGTGLGLSICHRIVTDLGGAITVDSSLGRGTLFSVRLLAAAERPAAPEPRNVIRPLAARRGRVLLIDDEPMIVSSLRRVLKPHHEVVAAANGRDAVDRLVRGERFDVLLCDLMMPEMSGMDLYAEVERLVPDQLGRIVFLTGGAFSRSARAFLDRVSNARLEKPFDVQALLTVVARSVTEATAPEAAGA